MRRIVACGGGNPTTSSLPLIEVGLDLTGATRPNILLVPTAATTQGAHNESVGDLNLLCAMRGLPLRVLHEFGELPTLEDTAEHLDWADAVYVDRGNTRLMLRQWVTAGLAELFRDAVDAGEVTAIGIGAGFMPWFSEGFSDANSFDVPEGTSWTYTGIDCLGNFDAVGCPHYNGQHPLTGELRSMLFQRYLRSQPLGTIGVGADESIALCVEGDIVTALWNGTPGMLHRMKVVAPGIIEVGALLPNESAPVAEFFDIAH